MDNVALAYGEGLLKLGISKKLTEKFKDDLNLVLDTLTEGELNDILKSYIFKATEKKNLIEKIFNNKIDGNIINFLKLLVDKNRVIYLKDIIKEFNNLILNEEGYTNGLIYSAIKLSDEKIADLEEKISKIFNKKVKLKMSIDKTLIAGIKVLVEGRMLDASIKGNLEKLKQEVSLEY